MDEEQPAPTRWRQGSKWCSSRLSISIMARPEKQMIITPTNTLSVWKVAPATVIR
jgi:hypothetical protein